MEQGLCNIYEIPTEYFFEDYLKSRKIYDMVNQMCKKCPVRKQCFNYGTLTKSTGAWGGKWLQSGTVVDTITTTVIEENIL